MGSNQLRDYTFKIVLLGDSASGKTAILNRLSSGRYTGKTWATVGGDVSFKKMTVDNSNVNLILWDTAGMERFGAITAGFLRNVHGIIFVYDITDRTSYENIPNWIQFAMEKGPENYVKILIGNKCDRSNTRVVDTKVAQEFAESRDLAFFETSAKEDINCDAAFRAVATAILQNEVVLSSAISRSNFQGINEGSIRQRGKTSGCC
ncbi:unnamed protein product [Orchesella dallaii]|uniref:Uncharacterized protein n=1 Tax=Orchesella dallaii TaxID=48710 RepID=A0ABP1RHR6_9HEXA